MDHPMQQIETDEQGIKRFRRNKIVEYLLDNGGLDMNAIACVSFDNEDRRQFAQLIGYSISGYSDLSYVDDASYATVMSVVENGMDEKDARIRFLENMIKSLDVYMQIAEDNPSQICEQN
jgi:hypothetical protein